MKTIYTIILGTILTLLPYQLYAYELNESDANMIGHVTDKHSHEHLPFITISLKGTTIGKWRFHQ